MLNVEITRFIFSGSGDALGGNCKIALESYKKMECTVRAHELPGVLFTALAFQSVCTSPYWVFFQGFGVFLHNKCDFCCVLQSRFHSPCAGRAIGKGSSTVVIALWGIFIVMFSPIS